jgi:hypothetical protein
MICQLPGQCWELGEEMRKPYRKQLYDPTYELDTPVPASKKEKTERDRFLEAGLGTKTLEVVHLAKLCQSRLK